jgi:hypothetical protein
MTDKVDPVKDFFRRLETESTGFTVTGKKTEVTVKVVRGNPRDDKSEVQLRYCDHDRKTESGATILNRGVLVWALMSDREDAKLYRGKSDDLADQLANIIRNINPGLTLEHVRIVSAK